MESKERELILKLSHSNIALQRLYRQHERFEKELNRLQRNRFKSANQEMHEKKLKIRKLRGVDEMLAILRSHDRCANAA